ncbi:MAG: hypothetical protein K2N36_04515 [Ruminiclostridium sp.]|nr:hypothetical protein [Ruminiclostridium sp.]
MATNKTLAQLKEQSAQSEAKTALLSLFDEDSFTELSPYTGESAVTGFGQIDSGLVYAFTQDSAIKSGAVCKAAAAKIVKVFKEAFKTGEPVIAV